MGKVLTIARHTLAESIRQRTAMFFVVVLVLLMLGLPFVTRGDNSLSGAVQSFLSYSVSSLGFLLSLATIFLARTVSEDLTGKQILVVMTKPVARWHYVVGKWLGIVALNASILAVCGCVIYAMTMYIAGQLRGLIILYATFGVLTLIACYALLRLLSPRHFTIGSWMAVCIVLLIALILATAGGLYVVWQAVPAPRWAWIAGACAAPFAALLMGYAALQLIVPRQMPLKRWSLIFGLCFGVSLLGGSVLYSLMSYQKNFVPRDDFDRERLATEILQARHGAKFILPVDELRADANAAFEQNVEQGRYANMTDLDKDVEIKRLFDDNERAWRLVQPMSARVFEFDGLQCDRSPESLVHISYRLHVLQYAPDEVVRCMWVVGDRRKGAQEYLIARRDVIDRRHMLPVPADAVAPDGTLQAVFVNQNPWVALGEQQAANLVLFEGDDAVEVLFGVSTFGSNLLRALALVQCRLMFLAAMAIMLVTWLSFPVACLGALTAYFIAATPKFMDQSLDWLPDEGVVKWFTRAMQLLLWAIHTLLLPKFTRFDGVPTLVDGRNVSLMWVLQSIGRLVLVQSGALLLAACLIFRRREVSEISL